MAIADEKLKDEKRKVSAGSCVVCLLAVESNCCHSERHALSNLTHTLTHTYGAAVRLVVRVRDTAREQELERRSAEKIEHLRELMKKHNEERGKARLYIKALERDNEVRHTRDASCYSRYD